MKPKKTQQIQPQIKKKIIFGSVDDIIPDSPVMKRTLEMQKEKEQKTAESDEFKPEGSLVYFQRPADGEPGPLYINKAKEEFPQLLSGYHIPKPDEWLPKKMEIQSAKPVSCEFWAYDRHWDHVGGMDCIYCEKQMADFKISCHVGPGASKVEALCYYCDEVHQTDLGVGDIELIEKFGTRQFPADYRDVPRHWDVAVYRKRKSRSCKRRARNPHRYQPFPNGTFVRWADPAESDMFGKAFKSLGRKRVNNRGSYLIGIEPSLSVGTEVCIPEEKFKTWIPAVGDYLQEIGKDGPESIWWLGKQIQSYASFYVVNQSTVDSKRSRPYCGMPFPSNKFMPMMPVVGMAQREEGSGTLEFWRTRDSRKEVVAFSGGTHVCLEDFSKLDLKNEQDKKDIDEFLCIIRKMGVRF